MRPRSLFTGESSKLKAQRKIPLYFTFHLSPFSFELPHKLKTQNTKLRPCQIVLYLIFAVMVNACASPGGSLKYTPEEKTGLWAPCTASEAENWEPKMGANPRAALSAARCYAVLARSGSTRETRLAYAVSGRKWALKALDQNPQDGTAHYLAAYLAGIEAENEPLKGLKLVPVIEREALDAAQLNPHLDHGGPDRMLGELYLRAPEPPVSIGDLGKALKHYQRAAALDPDFPENYLGLAEAYLEDESPAQACEALSRALDRITPCPEQKAAWSKTLKLMKWLCGMQNR